MLKKLFYFLFVLAISTSSWADEFVPFTSVTCQVSPGIITYNATLTGGYEITEITWVGLATAINTSTWGLELNCDISGPLGSATIILGSGTTFPPGNNFTGTITSFIGDPAGVWTFDFYDTYDNGADGVADAVWDNIDLTFVVPTATPICNSPLYPVDLATNITLSGNFIWDLPQYTAGVKIWFGTDGNGSTEPTNIENGTDLGFVSTYPFSGLTAGTEYYWKIVPYNYLGEATGCLIWSFTTSNSNYVTAIYSSGDIPTNYGSYVPSCNGAATPLSVSLPAGSWKVVGVDVAYDFKAINYAYMSEQHSRLACQESGTNEGIFYSGAGNLEGTYSYLRTGLTFANGIYSGNLTFELQAYRAWPNTYGCGTDHQYIPDGTWTVTVYYKCLDPTDSKAKHITHSHADLSWTSAASMFNVKYNAGSDFDPETSGTLVSPDPVTTSCSLSGLSAFTEYYWYVRSDCGGGYFSDWAGPHVFTSGCYGNTTFPWNEDFEGAFLPACWTSEITGNGSISQGTGNHTTGGAFSIEMQGSDPTYVFSEPQMIDAIHTAFYFWYKKELGNYWATNTLGYGIGTTTDPGDYTWTAVSLTTDWQEKIVDLSLYIGQEVYIAFNHFNHSSGIFIDDISLDIPPCWNPTGLSTTNITESSADLSWNSSASLFQVKYNAGSNFDPDIAGLQVSPDPTATSSALSGLSAGTWHFWYVRADCGGGDYSDWVGPHTFKTNGGLPDLPTKLWGMTPGSNIYSINMDGTDPINEKPLGTSTNVTELVQGPKGKLYGILGSGAYGNLFEYNPVSGEINILHTFQSATGYDQYRAPVYVESSNSLFGICSSGGPSGNGVIYEYSFIELGGGGYSIVHDFGTWIFDGVDPVGGLVYAGGELFGVARGGNNIKGVIFSFDPSTYLYETRAHFDGVNGKYYNGQRSNLVIEYYNLIIGSVRLIGTTLEGGVDNKGTVFIFNTGDNTITKLHDFGGSNGTNCIGDLVSASNGSIYGATKDGGLYGKGILFELEPVSIGPMDYTFKVINDFGINYDGKYPWGGLIEASNGKIYGTTEDGGSGFPYYKGIVYSYNPVDETYETVYNIGENGEGSSALYGKLLELPEYNIELKAFLEGPFNGVDMNTDLASIIPLMQPYNISSWDYSGPEIVTAIPSFTVDWVLLDIHNTTGPSYVNSYNSWTKKAVFILSDGSVVDIDGSSNIRFPMDFDQDLFITLMHRNHLSILNSSSLTSSNGTYSYDYSSGQSQVYGGNLGQKELSSGVWGMFAGDGENNGENNGDVDLLDLSLFNAEAGQSGYIMSDFNMDTQCDLKDKNDVLLINLGESSQVPY